MTISELIEDVQIKSLKKKLRNWFEFLCVFQVFQLLRFFENLGYRAWDDSYATNNAIILIQCTLIHISGDCNKI